MPGGPLPIRCDQLAAGCRHQHAAVIFSHNWAAVVGIALCVLMLVVWTERNTITLNERRRDWPE